MEQEPNQEELGQELADVLRSYGEERGFDEETCQEVADMPFGEAFEVAYGYLTQAGLDPDEILAPFMEQPEE